MFSLEQKKFIAGEVEKILLSLNHPEMSGSNPKFALHVDGVDSDSWADIKPNWTFNEANKPKTTSYNERVVAAVVDSHKAAIDGYKAVIESLRMQLMHKEKILAIYQQAVNKIDDLLEYRYLTMNMMELRSEILGILNGITDELKKL